MTLKYEVTEDDFWAFQDHFNRNAPEIKQLYRRYALWGSLIIGLVVYFLLHRSTDEVFGLLMGVLVALLWSAGMLTAHNWTAKSNRWFLGSTYRKLMQGVTGESELEIVPQGLHSKSRHGEGTLYWDAIGEVATTPNHTFIYVGRAGGFIIPNRRITSGNYSAFMQAFADVYAARHRDATPQAIPTPIVVPTPATVSKADNGETMQSVGRTGGQ